MPGTGTPLVTARATTLLQLASLSANSLANSVGVLAVVVGGRGGGAGDTQQQAVTTPNQNRQHRAC